MKILRTLLRVLVGTVFIFSGFVKGVDPMGTVFRMEDYFLAFGISWADPAAVPLTIFLCALEFLLGFSLLFNLWIRMTSWFLLAMMAYFTVLTFFDAVYNLVPDCGCFGEVIKLSNVETFLKNLVLMTMVIPVFLWRNKYRSALSVASETGLLALAAVLFTGFSIVCLLHLPVVDFGDWQIGKHIGAGAEKQVPVYVTYRNERTGETKEFLSPDYPWNDSLWMSEWTFVGQRFDRSGEADAILKIEDTAGNDLTHTLVNAPEYSFLLIAWDLDHANRQPMAEIQSLADSVSRFGYPFVCLTNAPAEDISRFQAETGLRMEFYNADDVVLKSMMRSNPGLILLRNGEILRKWHYNDFPDWTQVLETYLVPG
jgi:uncharacterized membrane protein YphA (DoxX/SURF4 family)